MKNYRRTLSLTMTMAFVAISFTSMAQSTMQYFRPNDKTGLNVFETTKNDTVPFAGLKVKVGGNFTEDFQVLKDENNATPVIVNGINSNQLMKLTAGFNLAMANLVIDAQLSDGIRVNLTAYLSTRHHEETWVKGGYVQFDKLLFLHSAFVDKIMEHLTIKVGDFDVDYGDQHFRRTDGGNSIYNPFVENYIMDEFATEIGAEIMYRSNTGLIVMGGITNGQLNPTVVAATKIDSATGNVNYYAPAFHGKIGYDKQISEDFRARITGSFYTLQSTSSNTLFFGDRTGSHYFFVMENTSATAAGNAWSGRYNPSFSEEVHTFMINPFIKYKGLEFFGTYEMAQGRTITEKSLRKATQYAVDLVYRFTTRENFWIGARYNSVTATMPGVANDITINRMTGSVGWFVTKNIMAKVEYVNEQYLNFAPTDIRSGGKFDGFMAEAAIAF
jgi:hypothetical protein